MNLIEKGDKGIKPLVGNLRTKFLVLNWRRLMRSFQVPRFQIIYARGGKGCEPLKDLEPIYGSFAFDSEDCEYKRQDFIGIATESLVKKAMADTTPVNGIDLSQRIYLLVAEDGTNERGRTVEEARQRLIRLTNAKIDSCFEVHPDSYVNSYGLIVYPYGAPPNEVRIRRGKTWTAG